MSDENLEVNVKEHEALGAQRTKLGFVKMPPGYALMLDHDEMYYYWLRHDGVQSDIHWDCWWIYHSAKLNSEAVESMEKIKNGR